MLLIFESSELKSLGFRSLFSSKVIYLQVRQEKILYEFSFKAKKSNLGLVSSIKENQKISLMIFVNDSMVESKILDSNQIQTIDWDICTPYFKGNIRIQIDRVDSFLAIENLARSKKNIKPITYLSKYIDESHQNGELRMTFDGSNYFTDKLIGNTAYRQERFVITNTLPDGWVCLCSRNKDLYYANLQRCYTQFEHPTSPKAKKDFLDKINAYRQVSDTKNIFDIFNHRKIKLQVDRKKMVESTKDFFLNFPREDINKRIHFHYIGEIGEDYGALGREFFTECSLELIKDRRICCNNGFYDIVVDLESASMKNESTPTGALSDDEFFKYLGTFLAVAFEKDMNIAIDFSFFFWESLLGKNYKLFHIQDPRVQKNMHLELKNRRSDGNCPSEIPISSNNDSSSDRTDTDQMVYDYFYSPKKESYEKIEMAFYKIVHSSFKSVFSPSDLSCIFSGTVTLNSAILKDCAKFINCTTTQTEVKDLFSILEEKDATFLRKFLQFVTGSTVIPFFGLKKGAFFWTLEFCEIEDMLFRATSCINKLYMGRYATKDRMRERLVFSIQNTEGFHKV